MRAGDLNRRITVQTKTATQNANGYPVDVWADTVTLWAQALTAGGKEFYAAQKINAETSILFIVRCTTAINTKQRIKYDNRYFEILSIADPDGKRVGLHVSAKEIV